MLSITIPSPARTAAFIKKQSGLNFTYSPQKGTSFKDTITGYDNDFLKEKIGFGEKDFVRAKEAIRQWHMFPLSWSKILPQNAPIETGITIAMYARFMGFWWHNACKIIYIIDEKTRFGFAYGTLPGHIECGEELFLVELDTDGNVFYSIKAFSKPRHILAKMAYPIMRRLQAKFRKDSAKQMRDFIKNTNK
jgi:uncharacterized protein (UPF0548 family)